MRKIWMLLGVVLLLAVLAIGAVACSDDGDDGGGATATEATDEVPIGLPSGETNTVIVTAGILTDSAGNTLYVFDNDSPRVSSCTGSCMDVWPPFLLLNDPTSGEGVEGTLAVITRDDGGQQVSYDGQPLYYYLNDEAPGERNGDNVGGVWHIVELE